MSDEASEQAAPVRPLLRDGLVGGALVKRMPAAVFAQHQAAFGDADGARVDDLVGGFFLQVAILVDAGLMGERIAPHDGLVGLRAESDD